MTCNVGNKDRLARFVLGLVILGTGYSYHSWFGLLGLVLVVTAALRWCPLYLPFGLKTP